MIELTPSSALLLYLLVALLALLGVWAYQQYSHKDRCILPPEESLRVCEYCHFVYLFEIAKDVSKCPQCQCFNKSPPQKQ